MSKTPSGAYQSGSKPVEDLKPPPKGFGTEVDEVLEHLKVLRLEPGDILVYRSTTMLSAAAAKHIMDRIQETFPGHRGIVIEEGATLGVVRRGEGS